MSRLDTAIARQVRHKIDWLAENADSVRHEAMTVQFRGMYRLRIGNYRAVNDLDQETRNMIVDAIGHRREIYGSASNAQGYRIWTKKRCHSPLAKPGAPSLTLVLCL